MRQRYAQIVRDEIAQTGGDLAAVEDEIRHAFAILAD